MPNVNSTRRDLKQTIEQIFVFSKIVATHIVFDSLYVTEHCLEYLKNSTEPNLASGVSHVLYRLV